MKILHVNFSDASGGAARAAYRLHRALVGSGIDSRMQVLHRGTDDDRVSVSAPRSLGIRFRQKLYRWWLARQQRNWSSDNPGLYSFGRIGVGLVDALNASDADIINLHWVPGMLSVTDIGRLRKPVVWTLHDMWAFCGGEHYVADGDNARFRQGYRADNRPVEESGPDLNRQAWEAKRREWSRQSFSLVSPSRWLAECARQSVLFSGLPVYVIPNPLDTERTWRPINRDAARTVLGLPADKKLILLGAIGGVADLRKGGDLVCHAVERLASSLSVGAELIIYGQNRPASDEWPCPVHWLGVVRDDRILVQAYSAADVMAVPSKQDNLPNTAVEAQACGTPVVAFDIGGLPDIVDHCETGWLAKPFDVADLAKGVEWLLADETRRAAVSARARQRAVARFGEPAIASAYREVYQQVLAAANSNR